jgi:fructokinase
LILCCGEALVDMVPDTTDEKLTYRPKLGGSVFNTACALGRLTAKVGFLSGVSNDPFGEQLIKALHSSHVDFSAVIRRDNLTTLAFVHLENGDAKYRFYDDNSAGRMIHFRDFAPIPSNVKAMFFGGISLCFDPAALTYQQVFDANTADKVTMIDANVRPKFVTNKVVYFERLKNMIAHADIVKVSEDDLNLLIDGADSAIEKLAIIKSMGPSIAILTKGAKGVSAMYSGGRIINVSAPDVKVKDTIGAGDTFNAGFLAMLEKCKLLNKTKIETISTDDLQGALEYGAKAAAIVVQREGANPPWAKELA